MPRLWIAVVPLAAFLHLALAIAAWSIGPGMNSDSATGFLLWDNWRAGLPWNHQVEPDPADISRDRSLFQAWWSPGQYLAVAPLQLIGLNLGQAIALGSFAWTAGGLFGWWRVFRDFGFSNAVSAWSVFILSCNWTLVRSYGDYMGGELILLALAPWLVLALRRAAGRAPALSNLAVPGLVWLGAMAKNTFLPVAGGVLLATRWPSLATAAPRRRIAELGFIGLGLLAGHALFWLTFLRHGWHPGSVPLAGPNADAGLNLLRLAAMPLGGLASLQNLLGRLFFHPVAPRAAGWSELLPLLLVLAAILAPLTLWLIRRELRLRRDYGRLLAAVTLGSVAFFAVVAVTRDAAGLEERFLRPCSFLFAPAVVAAIADAPRRLLPATLASFIGLGTIYGATSGLVRARHLAHRGEPSPRGISQTSLSPAALAELLRLDRTLPSGSLIVLSSPEMALDVVRTRRWATHLEMLPLDSVAPRPLHGTVPQLVFVAGPAIVNDGRAAGLLARFADYPTGAWTQATFDGWTFFRAGSPALTGDERPARQHARNIEATHP